MTGKADSDENVTGSEEEVARSVGIRSAFNLDLLKPEEILIEALPLGVL